MGDSTLRGFAFWPMLHGMASGIYIHAGAHRTGTSSFQMFLSVNAEAIRARGYDLAYPGRDDIPGGRLRLRLPGPSTGGKRKQELREFLAEEMQAYSTAPDRPLILSEENIPGRMMPFYGGEFFPAIRRRLKFLKAHLPGPVDRLVYVLRPYDELFASAYRKRAEDNACPPFADLKPGMIAMEAGWPHVISALRDVLKPRELIVLTYEQRGSNRDLFGHLVPDLAGEDWVEPERSLNVSATDAGLMVLQKHYATGLTLERKEWQEVLRLYSSETGDRGFASFDEDETAQIRARYANDLAELREMPGVTLIE